MFGRTSNSNTSQRGLEGQTAVLHYLVKRGYEVLIPYGDHHRYDLAVYFPQQKNPLGSASAHLVRIQCKVGWLSEDGAVIDFNTMSLPYTTWRQSQARRLYRRCGILRCVLPRY